jgi:hypothetical protein
VGCGFVPGPRRPEVLAWPVGLQHRGQAQHRPDATQKWQSGNKKLVVALLNEGIADAWPWPA